LISVELDMTKDAGLVHGRSPAKDRGGCRAFPSLSTCILVCFVIGSLHAQQGVPQGVQQGAPQTLQQGVNPQSLYGRDTTQGVYVRDSAVAVEKFALAERMEHLKEWDKSADVLMEILRSYADRVVPSQVDQDNKIYQYTSVTPAVQERLARWPEDGLTVYRARYETEASAMLEAAHDDLAKLHRVFSLYFVTESAKRAATRLIDLYLERGEFAAAAWLGDRLLAWHPSLNDDRPKLLYRTAMAYHLAGNDDQATARLNQLRDKFPQAIATVRGADVVLAESLAQELSATREQLRQSAPDSWPTAFGAPDRARVPVVGGFGGARLFSIEYVKPNVRNVRSEQRRELQNENERDRSSGLMTGVLPVVDRGDLFFQDNAKIYAVNLESGQPLPGWAESYDAERMGRFSVSAFPTPRSQQCTLTVTDDAVLAIMGQPDLLMLRYTQNFGQRETRLVCLDRRTGKQRWVVQTRGLPDSAANLRNLEMFGSPLVVADTVYVQARGGKGMQFEDSYVMAFELASGKFRWACYIASANTQAQFWDADLGGILGQNVSHLAYSSGRLYALTNLGALAAIDAYGGTIVWLNIYPRDVVEPNRMMGFGNWNRTRIAQTSGTTKPWTYNPVVASQGKVFVLPSDGLHVHIYDAGSGIETKRIRLSQFDNAETMLGVVEDKLVVASDKQVFCIDWPNFDAVKKDRNDNLHWSNRSLVRSGTSEDSIRGRGFLTADSVIVPLAWQLVRLSLGSGSIVQRYPSRDGASWGEEEEPGNVLLTQDRLIIAGPSRVTVYTDLALAMSKLDAAIAAAPDDPDPRLSYAEMMFVAGKLDAAVARLDEAIALLGSGAGPGTSGTSRDRTFNTALTFAQKLAKDAGAGAGAPGGAGAGAATVKAAELANGLFDRAAVAATTASQKVNYRLSRAAFARARNQADVEVKLYQEVLSDAELRAVPVADADGDAAGAASIARRGIDDAIRRAGRAVYEPYERAAVEMLRSAESAIDAEQLQAVAQAYPNSTAAPRALLAAADAYEAAKDPRRATQVLRQVYFRYPDDAERARVVESLTRNYLALPNRVDVAIARLSYGAEKLPGTPRLTRPLTLPDGKTIDKDVSFSDALKRLRQYSASASARDLPDLRLPAVHSGKEAPFITDPQGSIISAVASLHVPPAEFARHDRVVAFAPGAGLRVYPIGSDRALLTCPTVTQAPRGIAWLGKDLLVWTDADLLLFSAQAGQQAESQPLWSSSIRGLPQVQVVAQSTNPNDDVEDESDDTGAAAGAGAGADGGVAQVQGQEIIIGPEGQAVIVQGEQRIVLRGRGRLRLQRGGGGGGGAIVGLNNIAALAGDAQPPADAPPGVEQITHVRPLADRIVVGTSAGRIVAFDLDGGKLLWQTRLGDRAASQLLGNDDFIVVFLLDENRSNGQLAVFDTFSGQVIARRTYGGATSGGQVPVNVALAPDGMLVFLMPDRLCGKDLFEPGGLERLTYSGPEGRRPDGNMPFQLSAAPDHLQIVGDRVITVADAGTSVRGFSLRTGKPLRFNQSDMVLRIGGQPGTHRVSLRVAGGKVYVATPQGVRGYDVDSGATWGPIVELRTTMNVKDLIVTQTHVLALAEPAGARARRQPNQPTPFVQLQTYSRAPVGPSGNESGKFDHKFDVNDNATILSWQAVEGGFYYLSGDQKLHFLRGARKG
jgi:outer membrane protein assembly factor BamB